MAERTKSNFFLYYSIHRQLCLPWYLNGARATYIKANEVYFKLIGGETQKTPCSDFALTRLFWQIENFIWKCKQ